MQRYSTFYGRWTTLPRTRDIQRQAMVNADSTASPGHEAPPPRSSLLSEMLCQSRHLLDDSDSEEDVLQVRCSSTPISSSFDSTNCRSTPEFKVTPMHEKLSSLFACPAYRWQWSQPEEQSLRDFSPTAGRRASQPAKEPVGSFKTISKLCKTRCVVRWQRWQNCWKYSRVDLTEESSSATFCMSCVCACS